MSEDFQYAMKWVDEVLPTLPDNVLIVIADRQHSRAAIKVRGLTPGEVGEVYGGMVEGAFKQLRGAVMNQGGEGDAALFHAGMLKGQAKTIDRAMTVCRDVEGPAPEAQPREKPAAAESGRVLNDEQISQLLQSLGQLPTADIFGLMCACGDQIMERTGRAVVAYSSAGADDMDPDNQMTVAYTRKADNAARLRDQLQAAGVEVRT